MVMWAGVGQAADQKSDPEAEMRRTIQQMPTHWENYVLLAHYLDEQQRFEAAAAVMREARVKAPALPPFFLLELTMAISQQVKTSPQLSPAAVRPLLAEALSVADEVIRRISEGETFRLKAELASALRGKGMVLDLQAKRVEQDEQRKQELSAENDRLWARAQTLVDEDRPPPTPAEIAAKKLDTEWNAAIDRAAQAFDRGKHVDEATAAFKAFIATHPDFDQAYVSIASYNWEAVRVDPKMPRETARRLLSEGLATLEEALRRHPDLIDALVYKSLILKMQGERLEQDPARAKALADEAARLIDRAKELRLRQKP